MKPPTNFTLIYDDYATGIRAKSFADQLAATLSEPDYAVAPWRCEMLDWDSLAADARLAADASDFVILSLRGDHGLSPALKQWVEAWLENARGGSAILIALFDAERSTPAHTDGTRNYLRHVASEAGIDFFGHWTAAPEPEMELPDDERGPAAALFPPLMTPAFAAA